MGAQPAEVVPIADSQHKRTLRALLAGREVALEDARAAVKWLRADVTVIESRDCNVRLRVPVHPKSAQDIRAGRSSS